MYTLNHACIAQSKLLLDNILTVLAFYHSISSFVYFKKNVAMNLTKFQIKLSKHSLGSKLNKEF